MHTASKYLDNSRAYIKSLAKTFASPIATNFDTQETQSIACTAELAS